MRKFLLFILSAMLFACATTTEKPINLTSFNLEKAKWIAAYTDDNSFDTSLAAPYFKKEFTLKGDVKSAKALVTGVGYFEFYLNDTKIGEQVLAPAVTRYDKTVKYLSFDITSYLQKGANTALSVVGNGFYNVHTKSAWKFNEAPWRNQPAFICEIAVQYDNGELEYIYSDASWLKATGPIVFDQIRNGEMYDARKELSEDTKWSSAHEVKGPLGKLSLQKMPQIKKTKTLQPISIVEPKEGIYVVDFGQNVSGWVKLAMKEPAGTDVAIKYGERIFNDGSLDQKELMRFVFSGNTQQTNYISKGGQIESYEPRFTYFGFQYVQIEGLSQKPSLSDIEAYMIHTAFDTIGHFTCSNSILNKIHENMQWSYLGNYHSFPEDCPHREKMGWTGDAQLVIEMALFNYDAFSAYRKWMNDFEDEQQPSGDLPGIIPTSGWGYTSGREPNFNPYGYGPQWEGAAISIPWQLYRYSGDTNYLSDFYPMMRNYIGHLENIAEGNLLNFGIDDHKWIVTETDGPYISSAYYHFFLLTMEDVAKVLGKEDDVQHFKALQKEVFSAFNKKYYNSSIYSYNNGGQTALSLALASGLVPTKDEAMVLETLVSAIEKNGYHFDAGVVGVKKVIDVLLEYDRKDVLYKLATQTSFPSFGYWIEQGANTMWQNWNGSQSLNHIMFGSIGDYFYKGLAGINPVDSLPGFKKILLTPQFPEDMDYLECFRVTKYGKLSTKWKRERGIIKYELTVPQNTTCTFIADGFTITSGNKNFEHISPSEISLSAGTYLLELN